MDVNRSIVRGHPVVWAETDLPFLASVFVRMGRVDETLLTSGMSHLLEHMVLATDWPVDEFNAAVGPLYTHFWFAGARDDALARLARTLEVMKAPPMSRLVRERNILGTEAYSRGRSHVGLHASLRFGSRGLGLIEFDEHGLHRATRDSVRAWATRFFTRGNVMLTMTGRPPDDAPWGLPAGALIDPPALQPIDYLDYPSSFVHGPNGIAGVSMLVHRSHAFMVATDIVTHRLRQWLRHSEGVTYSVDESYEPLDRTTAHYVVWADCRPTSATFVRNAIVSVLDDLASAGPTRAELDDGVARHARRIADPSSVYDRLGYTAAIELLGETVETDAELVEARQSVTAADVASAVSDAFRSLLVVAPYETPQLGGRFRPYPIDSPLEVPGRRFASTHEDNEETLVVGDTAVAIEGETTRAVAYADATAFLTWDDGSVALYGTDGFYVLVDPADWEDGENAADEARKHIDPDLLIDRSADPLAFETTELKAAEASYDEKDWVAAVEWFDRGLEPEPDNPRAWRMYAFALHNLELRGRAIDAARRANELEPDHSWTPGFLVRSLRDAGRMGEAVSLVRDIVQREPVRLASLSLAADLLTAAGQFVEAVRIGRRAAELFPDEATAWFAYGWSARGAGQWEIAEPGLRRAVELQPEQTMWHNNLGVLLLDTDRATEGLAAFDQALELDADNKYARANRCRALHILGRYDEAEAAWRDYIDWRAAGTAQVVAADPNDPVALVRHAQVLTLAERDLEALSVAREAIALRPDADAHRVAATALSWLDELPDARAELEAGLAIEPDHAGSLQDLAWAAGLTGERDVAASVLAKLQADEGDDAVRIARAAALLALGEIDRTRALLEDVVRRYPRDCCVISWLGLAELKSGSVDLAVEAAERVRLVEPRRCFVRRFLVRELEDAAA